MNSEHATPEVIDALVDIEIRRQEKEKESGVSGVMQLGAAQIARTAPAREEILEDEREIRGDPWRTSGPQLWRWGD